MDDKHAMTPFSLGLSLQWDLANVSQSTSLLRVRVCMNWRPESAGGIGLQ